MKRVITMAGAAAAVLALALSTTGCTQLRARAELNRGVRAYKAADYETAVQHFMTSVELDPTFTNARLYLATAYMSQYIPGATSRENEEKATKAFEHFNKVLEQDPENRTAIASIASLRFNQKNFDDAEEWHHRMLKVDPQSKDSYYTLGVIAWTRSFQSRMEARADMGMKQEDPGPLKDRKKRAELAEKYLPIIEEGIANLEKAIEVDHEHDDAMAYLNLLHRERADYAESKEGYEADIAKAEMWVQKAVETKKLKAQRQPQQIGIVAE
jgi:tetratricopeptide (TPR) repeat protein